jgi:hypothetical protein
MHFSPPKPPSRLPDGVKDLDFAWHHSGGAAAGPLLATTCDNGACEIWDVRSCSSVCKLALPKGERGRERTEERAGPARGTGRCNGT